jgi:hypothetical protein
VARLVLKKAGARMPVATPGRRQGRERIGGRAAAKPLLQTGIHCMCEFK